MRVMEKTSLIRRQHFAKSQWALKSNRMDARPLSRGSGFVVRSEGGRICCDFNGLERSFKA